MSIVFKLTAAGEAALVAAANDGFAAHTITHAGVSPTAISPGAAMPASPKMLSTISGGVVAANVIHLTIKDDSSDDYDVRSVGLYLDNGVLLGTYGQADPIVEKSAASIMLLTLDITVADGAADISVLEVGDTTFVNPPASTSVAGVVKLATPELTATGADDQTAVTPAALKPALDALASALAGVELALQNQINNKQALDGTLTALAGVTTAANKLIYSTGADAFATTDFSAFARTLLDDADAATARTTLGAQPLDATLTALAGQNLAADKIHYGTGADTASTTTLTAFARSLIDDADAAAARATLGAQAGDATLTALAGVTTAANKLIYSTGIDAFATTDFSAFARTLLDDGDAATARTTLGAQPLDATLTALAGVATAANKIPMFNGVDTVTTLTLNTSTALGTSDTDVPSQKAVKAYVDQLLASQDAMVYKGVINASSNPNYPAADAGWTYRISVAGRIGGASGPKVEAGDILICGVDSTATGNHATVGANWAIIQTNIDGALTTSNIGSTVQAYDAGLQSIAGLTVGANQGLYATGTDAYATYNLTAGGRALGGVAGTSGTFPYFSAANTVSLATLSAFARTILDDADAAAVRATIGAQPLDATLNALAGQNLAADKIHYGTGADTASTTTLTAFARSLIDDADAAAARATLGNVIPTLSISSLPTSNIGPIFVTEAQEIWLWVPAGSYWTAGYRSPRVGEVLFGTTIDPRPFEVPAIGGTFSKTDPKYKGLWAFAQENLLTVSQTQFNNELGAFWFVSVDSSTFRVPDLRGPNGYGMFPRWAAGGTDADTANARSLGSRQLDAIQKLSGVIGNMVFGIGDGSLASGVFAGPTDNGGSNIENGTNTRQRKVSYDMDSARVARDSIETRGRNVAFYPRIHI